MATTIDPFVSVIYDGAWSVSDFERAYKVQALVHGWDEAKTLASVPIFLKGKALRVYTAIASKVTLKEVFDGLKAACTMEPDKALHQFYDLKRKPGE
jgi:hypothetical protein